VDDLAIIGPDIQNINDIKSKLANAFDIKDLGPIQNYLGIQINRDLTEKTADENSKEFKYQKNQNQKNALNTGACCIEHSDRGT